MIEVGQRWRWVYGEDLSDLILEIVKVVENNEEYYTLKLVQAIKPLTAFDTLGRIFQFEKNCFISDASNKFELLKNQNRSNV